jgi:glycosyltransferase involved in cell wall biosynthesis
MRILFCNFEYPPLGGGGGVINALLAQELAKRHDITVLTSGGLNLPFESMEDGVQVIRAPVYFRRHQAVANLRSMLTFIPSGIRVGKQVLKRHQYDVINTHFVLPTGPVGDALGRFAGIPNVLTLHGGDLYDPTKSLSPHHHLLLRMWVRYLLKRADVVVGQSKDTLDNMRRFYAPEMGGLRIPLGIQPPVTRLASRKSYGFRGDETLLVTVGRLVARKAVNQLISMMARLREKRVRLLIIGDGPHEAALKAQVVEQQMEDRIVFLGHVAETEKFRLLRLCDIYVSTSQHEGFGLVFLEAMACGLPVICYDNGGQMDFLRDEESGFLVSLNELDLFQARCQLLIDRPELRRKMSAHNARRIAAFYIDQCALRYEGVFKQLLEARANGKRLFELPIIQTASGFE